MLLAASVSLLALAALGPPSPTTTTSTIATSTSLGRSVDDARRELNVLAGVVAQRRMRAKAVPPFFCLEGADCARQLLDDHDAFVVDVDGVLWSSPSPSPPSPPSPSPLPAPDALGWLLPDTAETLALLQELGKTCVFVCTSDEQRQHDEQGDAEGATDARGACENAAAAKLEALGLDESVVAAEQIAPDAVCSMPSAELAAWLTETYGLDPSRTLVVGDRTDTDVALASAMGASSLLVLTGVARANDLMRDYPGVATVAPPKATCPNAVASHLGALLMGTLPRQERRSPPAARVAGLSPSLPFDRSVSTPNKAPRN